MVKGGFVKYLIFKSIRGMDRPWLVFKPEERSKPIEELWECGFATWEEAVQAVANFEANK